MRMSHRTSYVSVQTNLLGEPSEEMFSASELRNRGWTKGLKKKWLPTHDRDEANTPPKRSRRIWLARRVFEVEIDPRFALDAQSRKSMVHRAQVARNASLERALMMADAISLDSFQVPLNFSGVAEAALGPACEGLRDTEGHLIGWDFLAVQYLIDHAAPLFHELDELFGMPGAVAARTRLGDRLLLKIEHDALVLKMPGGI